MAEPTPTTTPAPRAEINPPLDPGKLGVQFSRSPEGHQGVTMGPDSLEEIFRTDEPFQGAALEHR